MSPEFLSPEFRSKASCVWSLGGPTILLRPRLLPNSDPKSVVAQFSGILATTQGSEKMSLRTSACSRRLTERLSLSGGEE